jgi:hypothetical protein
MVLQALEGIENVGVVGFRLGHVAEKSELVCASCRESSCPRTTHEPMVLASQFSL